MLNRKRLLVFLLDIALIAVAYLLAFFLRFDFHIPADMRDLLTNGLFIVVIVKSTVLLTSGMYRSLWRYASLQDGIEIFKTVTISSIISAFAIMFLRHFAPYPRSIFILDWILLLSLVTASRLIWRIYRETYIVSKPTDGKPTLIIGAGEAGSLLLKEIRRQPESRYQIVGFVDDDPDKAGMRMHGVPVLGPVRHLKGIIRKNDVEEVIIAMPSGSAKLVRAIIDSCERCKVRFKILPGIGDLIGGKISVSQIKEVEIGDILGRDPVILDEASICDYLTDKKVLVTGAAGSIGSEICRQVARFSPKKIILFDSAETPLFYLEKELSGAFNKLRIIPVIGDVRDKERVEAVFEEFQPDAVFHAAAYKHVFMMECNPVEALTNNIGGTKVLADAAHRFNVKNFVMVSTDKAVNPTNIMGASKRISEIYVQALAGLSTTNFTTVRFGNVLGSNGSVIPLFKEQIRNGGPVTVTHPEVIRYFMTIPEASQLVLQAGCIGNGGEIFVLDMGEPIKILDLAEELIRLSGFVPYEEIDIVFTGLKPGEKLYEELIIQGEGVKETSHQKIRVVSAIKYDFPAISAALTELFAMAKLNDVSSVVALFQELLPEFNPNYTFTSQPPLSFCRMRPDLFPPREIVFH